MFSFCPSRRAVPATPGEQTGVPTDSCRPVLPSPPLQWLASPFPVTRLHLGSLMLRPVASQPQVASCDVLAPLLPDASRHLAGGLASRLSVLVGMDSFHSIGSVAALHGARRGPGRGGGGGGWRNSWVGGDPKRARRSGRYAAHPSPWPSPRKRGEGTRKGDQGAYTFMSGGEEHISNPVPSPPSAGERARERGRSMPRGMEK